MKKGLPSANEIASQPKSQSGVEMHDLMRELYPLCRSITGNGVRETLRILQRHIPLQTQEVASGTAVFDWTVPKEWNLREAYVKNSKGEKIIDFRESNLHVLNYSMPVQKTGLTGRTEKSSFFIAGAPGLDSLPDLLLQ